VHDEAHVGTIDAHAERDRRDDDVDLFVEERVLIAMPLVVGEARVVRHRTNTALAQPVGQRVDLAPRLTVDDARFAAMPRQDVLQLPLQIRSDQHAIDEVRPIERADELGGISQVELRQDVAPHARRRRRRERVKADVRPHATEIGELPVFRAKIVSPLADAVRFVDRDEANGLPADERSKRLAALADESLRRDVEQPIASGGQPGGDLLPRVARHPAVKARRRHAVADERVDLILHQRDQRRDDDGEAAVVREGGNLKAERLAAAGRQDDERIAAGENRIHRLALHRPERRVAPVALEEGEQRIGHQGIVDRRSGSGVPGSKVLGFGF
jgi:hypothetical protein